MLASQAQRHAHLVKHLQRWFGSQTKQMAPINVTEYAEAHESNARSYSRRFPVNFTRGSGIYLYDSQDNEYVDCLACAGALPMGHNHPAIKKAAIDFLNNDGPTQLLDLYSDVRIDLMDRLLAIFDEIGMKDMKLQFCAPSGADAVEAAIKLSKIVTQRKNIIVFNGGYHGHTQSTLAMMGNLGTKQAVNGLMEGVHFMPYPYEYRSIPGITAMDEFSANYIEYMLNDDECGIAKPAAIIFEPVQGEGGVIPASKHWMQRIRAIATKHDIPLIADEVQSGFGRTGQYFGFQHGEIHPDIVCMSKAIGGSFPLSVIAFDRKFDGWNPGNHAGTFRGNQLAIATGAEFLKILPSLLDNVQSNGEYLMRQLESLQAQYPFMGDVRGRGYMVGVEMTDFETHSKREVARAIQKACFDNKLILECGGRNSSVLRFLMPLVTTKPEMDIILQKLGKALETFTNSV